MQQPQVPSLPVRPNELDIRIMSFNIWRSGGRSLEKTIETIRALAVDVVGLQECSVEAAKEIAAKLGYQIAHDERSNAILSRHEIAMIGRTKSDWGGIGASITLEGGQRIHVFSTHLHWDKYGPYSLQEDKDETFVIAQENEMRMPGLDEIFDMMKPFVARKASEPCFLLGDFNAPSHLDYAAVAWPESIACYARGLVDSYRALHTENRTYALKGKPFAFDDPGITWSPIVAEEARGVFDRIDFIYYTATERITPTILMEIDGRNGSVDTWPSDHRAVLSTFSMTTLAKS